MKLVSLEVPFLQRQIRCSGSIAPRSGSSRMERRISFGKYVDKSHMYNDWNGSCSNIDRCHRKHLPLSLGQCIGSLKGVGAVSDSFRCDAITSPSSITIEFISLKNGKFIWKVLIQIYKRIQPERLICQEREGSISFYKSELFAFSTVGIWSNMFHLEELKVALSKWVCVDSKYQ